MTFIQRIRPLDDPRCDGAHGDCFIIDCVTTEPVLREDGSVIHEAGTIVWHSHMDAMIHPEHRLNPSHPAEDHRGAKPVPVTVTEWCADCTVLRGDT